MTTAASPAAAAAYLLLLLLLCLFSSLLFSFSFELNVEHRPITTQSSITCSDINPLDCEIQELKFRVARLEYKLEENSKELSARSLYIEKCAKKIEDLTDKNLGLQSVSSNLKDFSLKDEHLIALEQEVQLLWAASRKNNFDIHILESKAEDAEKQLNVVASRTKQMANIVTELWLQIQQLEQALQDTQMKTIYLQRQIGYMRCPFFKFISKISGRQVSEIVRMVDSSVSQKGTGWSFYVSEILSQAKGLLTEVKIYHHQLQGTVRQGMKRHELLAAFANEEVGFFVASALVVVPVMVVWMWLSSHWS